MRKNMEAVASGLKCDHCDWKDMSIKAEDYHKYINAKCPKCGENILTKEDYKAYKRLTILVRLINMLPLKKGNKITRFRVSSDGSGQLEFKELKK